MNLILFVIGADNENRTRDLCLEGRYFTPKLYPHFYEPSSTAVSEVIYSAHLLRWSLLNWCQKRDSNPHGISPDRFSYHYGFRHLLIMNETVCSLESIFFLLIRRWVYILYALSLSEIGTVLPLGEASPFSPHSALESLLTCSCLPSKYAHLREHVIPLRLFLFKSL